MHTLNCGFCNLVCMGFLLCPNYDVGCFMELQANLEHILADGLGSLYHTAGLVSILRERNQEIAGSQIQSLAALAVEEVGVSLRLLFVQVQILRDVDTHLFGAL